MGVNMVPTEPARNSVSKSALVCYFFDKIEGSLEALDKNLEDVLKQKLNPKELALVLFHSTMNAKAGLYGDPAQARRTIESHIQKWADKTIKQKEGFSHFTSTHMLFAFRELELRPPERFLEFVLKKTEDDIKDYSALNLVSTLDSLARLGIDPGKKILQKAGERLPQVVSSMTISESFECLYALGILDAIGEHHHGAKRYPLGGTYNTLLKNQIFRSKIAAGETKAQLKMLADAIAWFRPTEPISATFEDSANPIFEKDVSATLESAGALILEPRQLRKPHHKLDLTASFGKATFHVECDGPTHFVRSADDHKVYMNGSTLFQTALIHRALPDETVLRIPHNVFYAKMDDRDMWEEVLITIDDKKPGAYILGPQGQFIELGGSFLDQSAGPN